MGSWTLTLGDASSNTGALADEQYDDIKAAFQEMLDIQGVDIMFAGMTKQCVVSQRVEEKLDWQQVGFVPQFHVTVEMLDTDFNEFDQAGVTDPIARVDFQGVSYQVSDIRRSSANPIVLVTLDKFK